MFLEKVINTRNQKWIDVEKMRSSGLPLVMYGAGIHASLCARFLQEHSIAIHAVCVTEKSFVHANQLFNDMPVKTLKEVGEEFSEFNCLIAFADIVAAKRNLLGLSGVREVFFIENPGVVEDMDYAFISGNRAAFERTYDMLGDAMSKDAFVDFLNIKISGIPIMTGIATPQYFCDIVPLRHDEVFIDCGAYDGDTLFSFLEKTQGSYEGIYAFEPDAGNYQKLAQNMEARDVHDMRLIRKGVWEKSDVLHFSSPVSTASRISHDGGLEVEVDSIDNVVAGGKATFIKMDIEGAELSALKGARHLIAREKPKLAVCVYHKAHDLISIPLFLSGLVPEYRFYLRRHSCFSLETVLYAIP